MTHDKVKEIYVDNMIEDFFNFFKEKQPEWTLTYVCSRENSYYIEAQIYDRFFGFNISYDVFKWYDVDEFIKESIYQRLEQRLSNAYERCKRIL